MQTTGIPLFNGIDTKTDARLVDSGRTLSANNVHYPQDRQVAKRFGQTQLGQLIANTTTSLTQATSLATSGQELLLYDGSKLYSYGAAQSAWIPKGNLTEVGVSKIPVVQNAFQRSSSTVAVLGTIEVYVWEDSRGGLRYSVRDSVTNAFYVADQVLDGAGSNPQLQICGGRLNVFYLAGSTIYAKQVTAVNPGAGFGQTYTIANGVLPNVPLAVTVSNSGTMYLAYATTNPGFVNIITLGSNLVIGGNGGAIPAPYPPQGIAIALSPDQSQGVLVVASAGSATQVTTFAVPSVSYTSYTTTAFQAVVNVSCVWTSNTAFTVVVSQTALILKSNCVIINCTLSGGNVVFPAAQITVWGLQLATQAFLQNGQALFVGITPQLALNSVLSGQTSYVLVSQTGALLLRFAGQLASGPQNQLSQVVPTATAGVYLTALPFREQLRATSAGAFYTTTGLAGFGLTFPTISKLRTAEFNFSTVISCGATYCYDGANLVESGFWEFPEGGSATLTGNPGGLSAGLYSYIATYEWSDAAGNVHRSAPSYVMPVTATAGSTGRVQVPPTSLTRRTGQATDAQIVLYRALVNQSGPYYEVARASNSPAFSGNLTVTFVDAQPDSAISGQPFLYAPPDGAGELENDPPPAFAALVATKTRVFGIPQEDQTALWYTKPLSPGQPANWSQAQVVRIESVGGAATALGAMDKQCIIFKTGRMYVLPGDGPNSGGQPIDGFTAPELISSATGCTQAGSIVQTDKGLFYQSPRGIELLTRGFDVQYDVGFPVYAYRNVPLVASVVVPDQSQLRFMSGGSTALVYNYTLNRWSTYDNQACVGAVYWQGALTRATATGQVWKEDSTTYLDGGVPVSLSIETAWLKPAQMAQGFARVRRFAVLGNYLDSHLLYIDIALDYKDYQFTLVWNPQTGLAVTYYGDGTPYGGGVDTVYGGPRGGGSIYQVRARMPVQKCESVKFRIRDGSVTGGSATFNELALELDPKSGVNRLPSGQSV